MLKYLVRPIPIWTFERRWKRRLLVVVALPQELLRALKNVIVDAGRMWRVSDEEIAAIKDFLDRQQQPDGG